MVDRPFWRARIERAWAQAPIVWLAGVRRSGKTTLARAVAGPDAVFVNCDDPTSQRRVADPIRFFRENQSRIVVFDEIHQLGDPSLVLKIGADEFPALRILATGSSTLAASRKFRDTLTGRKRLVHLVPALLEELPAFGEATLDHRLLAGGLPQALMAAEPDVSFYREWMDSFFARDVQRLFGFRDMNRFNEVFEYVLRGSGGSFSVNGAATELGVARPTIESHLRALAITHAVTVVRPYHAGTRREIVKQPKVYGFDTGFVAFARGWESLRPDDRGPLWEHVVLEHLLAHLPDRTIATWRDKVDHEVDFVVAGARDQVDAIECKWSDRAFSPVNLHAFRAMHPQGRNFVVTPRSGPPLTRSIGGLEVTFTSPGTLPLVRPARSARA